MQIELYKITNLINGKVYIGQTTNLTVRLQNHCTLKNGTAISCAIQKYGEENFVADSLGFCLSRHSSDIAEKELIKYWKSKGEVYNRSEGGDSAIGFRHSEETKKRMSETRKGRQITWGDKISIANTGRKLSQKTKDKISLSQKGIKKSKEFVENLKHIFKDRKITWGSKISEGLKGRQLSQESKNKISLALKGTKVLSDTKEKMSLSHINRWGKINSEKRSEIILKGHKTRALKFEEELRGMEIVRWEN